MDEDAVEVIVRAQQIVYVAGWRLCEEMALQRLAGTHGIAHTPLEPRSDVIQLVACDGQHVGHVRLEGPHGNRERWIAVRKGQARPVGSFGSAAAAAAALAAGPGGTMGDED